MTKEITYAPTVRLIRRLSLRRKAYRMESKNLARRLRAADRLVTVAAHRYRDQEAYMPEVSGSVSTTRARRKGGPQAFGMDSFSRGFGGSSDEGGGGSPLQHDGERKPGRPREKLTRTRRGHR